jgi:LysR family transcriptional regulator, transcriptional activator of nhaA
VDWLNYHHLHYFWMTAKEGSIASASAKLHISQPSISVQIKRLEEALDVKLFQKYGRSLVLTDVGRVVYQHADVIFGAGHDLLGVVKTAQLGRAMPLTIGVANAVPKLVVCRLLRPLLLSSTPPRLVCREDNTEQLLANLATHAIDVVLADTPAPPHVRVKVFNHILGKSDTAFFVHSDKAAALKRRFPQSLHGAKMVMPTPNTALRRDLDAWFDTNGIKPIILAEFEDPALMKVVGAENGAVFPAPRAIAEDVRRVYDVAIVGSTDEVEERYYAISVERRLTHPGVLAITSAARDRLFK